MLSCEKFLLETSVIASVNCLTITLILVLLFSDTTLIPEKLDHDGKWCCNVSYYSDVHFPWAIDPCCLFATSSDLILSDCGSAFRLSCVAYSLWACCINAEFNIRFGAGNDYSYKRSFSSMIASWVEQDWLRYSVPFYSLSPPCVVLITGKEIGPTIKKCLWLRGGRARVQSRGASVICVEVRCCEALTSLRGFGEG